MAPLKKNVAVICVLFCVNEFLIKLVNVLFPL